MNKLFDLRFIIGLFFLVIGGLLLAYSYTALQADAKTINRSCGLIFLLFSVIMLLLSCRSNDQSS